jgi:hypothetical protein
MTKTHHRHFVYVDPKTFNESKTTFSGKDLNTVAKKIYQNIIEEYRDHNTIIPPLLVIYIYDKESPKKIYGFEANVASFNMKPHVVSLTLNGTERSFNINNCNPRISEIDVSSKIKKRILKKKSSKEFAKESSKKTFYDNFLLNQTYDIHSLFKNLSDKKHAIIINEHHADTSTVLFKIIDNYLLISDTINLYICTSKFKNEKICLNLHNDNLFINFPCGEDFERVEICISNIDDQIHSKIRKELVSAHGKENII